MSSGLPALPRIKVDNTLGALFLGNLFGAMYVPIVRCNMWRNSLPHYRKSLRHNMCAVLCLLQEELQGSPDFQVFGLFMLSLSDSLELMMPNRFIFSGMLWDDLVSGDQPWDAQDS